FLIREISTKIITSNIWWENPLNRFSGEVSISIILGNFSQYFWGIALSRSGKYLKIYLTQTVKFFCIERWWLERLFSKLGSRKNYNF
ncbi:hypothetical protein, partial [Okeania sp. SIO3I5]|uniref:hypothetical protein n=1 Tax=Okeania sp. SIO3I5 TaxID=2607805 RepID=UPI0025F15E50